MSFSDAPEYKKSSPFSAKRITDISASTVTLNPPVDGFHCNTAGDITIVPTNADSDSDTVTLTLSAGGTYPYSARKLTAVSGAVVKALYLT